VPRAAAGRVAALVISVNRHPVLPSLCAVPLSPALCTNVTKHSPAACHMRPPPPFLPAVCQHQGSEETHFRAATQGQALMQGPSWVGRGGGCQARWVQRLFSFNASAVLATAIASRTWSAADHDDKVHCSPPSPPRCGDRPGPRRCSHARLALTHRLHS
jgi:hypothetical protein